MASANDGGDRAAAGILRLLLGMAAPTAFARGGGGVVLVQQIIIDGDGDVFSGGIGGGVPPASKSAIAALKEVKAGEDGQEGGGSLGECAICLDGVEGAAKEMPCGHRFHGECLERWLGVHGNCPVCRHELPAAKEEEAAAEGGGEARRPRSATVVSYVVQLGGEREQQPQQEREEPWTIRIEDVD
ncbi:hypothetical protein EJB05_11060, partial [Eragrostis curvula]